MIYALPIDSRKVEELRTIIIEHREQLHAKIIFIDTSYSFIIEKIRVFESSNLPISTALAHLDEVLTKVSEVNGDIGRIVYGHFEGIISRNPDLRTIYEINQLLRSGADNLTGKIPIHPANLPFFSNCNLTSVDTERFFSRYKFLINDRRHFKFENLHKYFFLHCNSFIDESNAQ